MALIVKKREVERLARLRLRVAKRGREADILEYLEREVWPAVPKRLLGRCLSRREEDRILGYGREHARAATSPGRISTPRSRGQAR
jgi:hypothetical protein